MCKFTTFFVATGFLKISCFSKLLNEIFYSSLNYFEIFLLSLLFKLKGEKKIMITVRVLDRKTGDPVRDVKVALGFPGMFLMYPTNDEYTDEYGEAHFDHEPGNGVVYINGRKVREGNLQGLVIIYID